MVVLDERSPLGVDEDVAQLVERPCRRIGFQVEIILYLLTSLLCKLRSQWGRVSVDLRKHEQVGQETRI